MRHITLELRKTIIYSWAIQLLICKFSQPFYMNRWLYDNDVDPSRIHYGYYFFFGVRKQRVKLYSHLLNQIIAMSYVKIIRNFFFSSILCFFFFELLVNFRFMDIIDVN